MTARFLLLATAVALLACGGATTSGATPADVAAYRGSALAASTAVATYRTSAQGAATPGDCQAATQQYAAQMHDALGAMRRAAGRMDEHMRGMGQPAAADMACGADVMAAMLQEHLGVACASPDMAQNRRLAEQHCQAMADDADHLQMRAAGMQAMTAGGMMGPGGMMGSDDMSAAMQDMMRAGYTARDGHHMSWGEHITGCAP